MSLPSDTNRKIQNIVQVGKIIAVEPTVLGTLYMQHEHKGVEKGGSTTDGVKDD